MATVPLEFDPANIQANSPPAAYMYGDDTMANEPMKSVLENNPEICFVPPKRGAEWGTWEFKPGSYYDTTTGSKHSYWKDTCLPSPTKDIGQLRSDLIEWGYCIVEDAIASEQVETIRRRVLEQAEGERQARIAQKTPSGQNINCCVNKGRCFEGLIAQDPSVVQGGPLIEQLMTEALGPGWICTSLIAAMSLKGGVPQALHQDQSDSAEALAPTLVNTLTAISAVDETNGGTLLIPGSHKILSDAMRERRPVGKLPPAINLEAPAGSVTLTDGRILHGTGINHTDDPRIVLLCSMQANWKRQQENWMLSVRPEVLERATPKLLQRMGFQATTGGQTNEGHGFGAQGLIGEDAGALRDFRLAADRGEYVRVGELGPDSPEAELQAPFTLREVVGKARSNGNSAPLGIGGKHEID
jgi:ectoine hydroxylase-related dioxygenase (phytanoyl-CoA dioxygenase family)